MKRTPLTAQFEDLEIGESPRREELSMGSRLKETMRGGWPAWRGTFSKQARERMSFTIKADPMYRTYATSGNPTELFEKASGWLINIKMMDIDEEKEELIEREVTETMCRAIFGSNHIERVGLDLAVTINLCRRIFAGEDVGEEFAERTPEYEALLKGVIAQQRGKREQVHKHVIRSRREVVQHARAFQYLVYVMVVENDPLSEDLIKKVHSILCKDVNITHEDGHETPFAIYAGRYRQIPVSAGNTMFTSPKFVPREMAEFIATFNKEVQEAEKNQCLDPFALAAKYCLSFVQIHPFQDGNGRTCRMILNAILCKYAGIIVSIGEHDEERAEYLEIKQRASAEMEGAGELATFVLQRATTRLRALKQKLSGRANKNQRPG
ncbi:hypothetical protein MMC16_006558 [Acarospora aff. strigata]|nr:hypothetical protein [Acarospora aff. strigata]